jgi:REP element-mobilizing transposase RayT
MSPTKPCLNRVAPAASRPGHAALRRGRVTLHNGVYFVTAATYRRIALFRNCCAARTAARSFEDPQVLGDASMLAWVLMPDHAHWLIQLGATTPLGVCVGRIKSASSREINRACRRRGCVWAPAFHDHALRAEEDVAVAARYLVANPLRAGLVDRIGDYPYWNAVWI